MRFFGILAAATGAALGLAAAGARAELPEGYPASYQQVIDAAQKEGKVVVYSTTNSANGQILIRDFKALYPSVQVEYNELNSTEIYSRFISESAANARAADVLWSSAMDTLMKLVADGYALPYASPESKALPDWAKFEDKAWGTTLEALVTIYNKRLLAEDMVPKSHADLLRLATEKRDVLAGKITKYDIEKSATGFLMAVQDQQLWPKYWDMIAAFGKANAKYYPSTGTMIEKVMAGEHLIGYNVPAPYAELRKLTEPNLGIVYPSDYTMALSRITFIAKSSQRPNAAKLFVDYLLSKRGQDVMANKAEMNAIRTDVAGTATAAQLQKDLGDRLKPIPVSTSLTEYLEPKKRLEVLNRWKRSSRG